MFITKTFLVNDHLTHYVIYITPDFICVIALSKARKCWSTNSSWDGTLFPPFHFFLHILFLDFTPSTIYHLPPCKKLKFITSLITKNQRNPCESRKKILVNLQFKLSQSSPALGSPSEIPRKSPSTEAGKDSWEIAVAAQELSWS